MGERVARQLRQQRPQRMTAVQLVGPVGADDHDPLRAERAREEAHEAARGAVGPMQVLDHEQQAVLLGHRVEHRQQRLEDPHLLGLRGLLARLAAEHGQDRREIRELALGQAVEGRVAVACDPAQRPHERGVGQLALAELHAVAAQHARARVARGAHQLAGQARLADAGLARHQRERRSARGAGLECPAQLTKLGGATDEARAGDPGRHALTMLPLDDCRRARHGPSLDRFARLDIGHSQRLTPYPGGRTP